MFTHSVVQKSKFSFKELTKIKRLISRDRGPLKINHVTEIHVITKRKQLRHEKRGIGVLPRIDTIEPLWWLTEVVTPRVTRIITSSRQRLTVIFHSHGPMQAYWHELPVKFALKYFLRLTDPNDDQALH